MNAYCRATLHYLDGEDLVPVDVEIGDGRDAGPLSWGENGFERIRHVSALSSWDDIGPDSLHYDEIGELATALTGCDAVLFYPALLRSPRTARASADLAPVQFVHSDYTERYRSMLEDDAHPYRALIAPFMERAGVTGDDIRGARRIVTLQAWRNVGAARMSHPLALCDARTVSRARLTPVPVPEYGGLRTEFESFAVAPPETPGADAWFTFPELTRDELLVFRAYDSERSTNGEPFWTPHSAFADPTDDGSAPPRESVEMRAICLFG